MNSEYQEHIAHEPTPQDRVQTVFFILSLLLHLLVLYWFLSAGFGQHAKLPLQAETDLAKQLRLATLHGRPCKVFFDNRPYTPPSAGPAAAASPAGTKPQAPAQIKPKVVKKAIAQAQKPIKHTAQPKPQPVPLPAPTRAVPEPVLATPFAQPTLTQEAEAPASYHPTTDEPIIPHFTTPQTGTAAGGQQATAGGGEAGEEETRDTHNTCRNIIAMTKGFIERADLDELEESDYSDGQGSDDATNAGADQSAYAIEFTLYRSKVSDRFLTAWREHFSHLPIKKRFQIRQHLTYHDAVVSYTLNRDGKLIACSIVESTGDPEIDHRIVKSFELSVFPPFPQHFAQQTFTFTEDIRAAHLDGSEPYLELIRC